MKTLVRWRGNGAENPFQFMGEAEDGCSTPLGARYSTLAKSSSSPKEVVAMAQAACTGIDVVSTLEKMREPLQELEISCDIALTKDYPSVFEHCEMVYRVAGRGLQAEKVAHAIELSLIKYCGVSAMIERSGCRLIPRLFLNDEEISIWDPLGKKAAGLREWSVKIRDKSPRGLALVIGASRGIGRALVQQLSGMGFGVVPASRTAAKGERAVLESDRIALDLTNPLSRESFVSLIKAANVDFSTVIFNAGVMDSRMRNASQLDYAELRAVFDTNLFSLIDLNTMLLPLYKNGATLLFVSSYMGLPSSNDFNFSTYRLSKCAMTLYARELGKEMSERRRDVAVAALHPGSVLTELNPQGRMSPEESALRIALLLDPARREQILERNGEFWMAKEKDVRIDPWII